MVTFIRRHPAVAVLAITLGVGATGAPLDTIDGARADANRATGLDVGASRSTAPRIWGQHARTSSSPRIQELLARGAYARLWTRAAPLFGASGMAPPRLRFVGPAEPKPTPNAAMWVGPDESGARTVFVTPGQRRLLAKRGGNWRSHYAGLTRTLHETAHYFQSDEVLYDVAAREFGASRWAKAHGPSLLGTRRGPRPLAFDPWRDREQFGANFGADPATLGWPGTTFGTERPLTEPRTPGPIG